MKCIRRGEDDDLIDAAHLDPELVRDRATQTEEEFEAEQAKLLRNSKIAKWLTCFLTAALLVLWPFPMFGSGYIFSKEFFTGWVVIGIIWVFVAFIIVGIYPVWEGRNDIGHNLKEIFLDITGKRRSRGMSIDGVNAGNGEPHTPKDMAIFTEGKDTVKC